MGFIHKFPNFSYRRRRDSTENMRDTLLQDSCDGDARKAAVPKGYLAVYVGEEMKRIVIPASYLCLSPLRELMERVAEEFGFEQEGGLRFPCEEDEFIEMIKLLDIRRKKRSP